MLSNKASIPSSIPPSPKTFCVSKGGEISNLFLSHTSQIQDKTCHKRPSLRHHVTEKNFITKKNVIEVNTELLPPDILLSFAQF